MSLMQSKYMTEYKIKGILHDPQNGPISEITITAYDKDPLSGEKLGSVKSSSEGLFEISFSEKQFDFFHLEGAPEVYLVVSDTNQGFLSVKDQKGDFEKVQIFMEIRFGQVKSSWIFQI